MCLILSTVCNDPLGIEDRRIPDSSFFASTEYDSWHPASNARLNRPAGYAGSDTVGAWLPSTNDANQYIGVNLGGVKMVSGIVLQGREDYDRWVTKFKVGYKDDPGSELVFVMDANQQEEMVRLDLSFGCITCTHHYNQLYVHIGYNMTIENELSLKALGGMTIKLNVS